MKNLLEFLLNHLVDHPEDVQVEEIQDDSGFQYLLHVHTEDVGKVIGKNGSVINAIRTISKMRAIKEHIRVTIQLAENDKTTD